MRRHSKTASLTSSVLLLGAIYGGYHFWQDYGCPYRIQKLDSSYYLTEKKTDRKLRINKNFQLGSVTYRIDGILNESKKEVIETLENLARKYAKAR